MNEPTVIETLMSATTTVVTNAISWMGDFASAVASDTVLTLAVIAIPCVGLGVGLLGRLLRKRV